jgi:hypothetical protein
LIQRHESYALFTETGGEPVQRIHEFEESAFQIDYYYSETGDDFRPILRTFRFSSTALLRVGVIALPNHSYYFLVMHHILADGTSVTLLFNDLKALYQTGNYLGFVSSTRIMRCGRKV